MVDKYLETLIEKRENALNALEAKRLVYYNKGSDTDPQEIIDLGTEIESLAASVNTYTDCIDTYMNIRAKSIKALEKDASEIIEMAAKYKILSDYRDGIEIQKDRYILSANPRITYDDEVVFGVTIFEETDEMEEFKSPVFDPPIIKIPKQREVFHCGFSNVKNYKDAEELLDWFINDFPSLVDKAKDVKDE